MLTATSSINSCSWCNWKVHFISFKDSWGWNTFLQWISSLIIRILILESVICSSIGLGTHWAAIITERIDTLERESAARCLFLWFRKQGEIVVIHIKEIIFVSLRHSRCYRWMDNDDWGTKVEILIVIGQILNFNVVILVDLMRSERVRQRWWKWFIVFVFLRWNTAASIAFFTADLSNKALNNLIVISLELMLHLYSFKHTIYETKCGFIGLLLKMLSVAASSNYRFFCCFWDSQWHSV